MATSDRMRSEGKVDQAKGKIKEVAGALTGNNKTKAKGKAEDLKGKAKDTVGRATAKR